VPNITYATSERFVQRESTNMETDLLHDGERLFEILTNPFWLTLGWADVAKNKGAPGIDGVTVEAFQETRLHSLKNQQTLETDDHFLAANLSRKLLESFLSFKFPKNRGNFANLFNTAVSESQNPEDERKEKIRKFINEYSHNDLIETNEDFVENLIGEGVAVISDIFEWINELDEKHYQEMVEVVT